MNKTEVTAIMAMLKGAYPNSYKNSLDIEYTVQLWTQMLKDDSADSVAKAIKEFIQTDTGRFPPSIGQIRGMAKDIRIKELEERRRGQLQLDEPNGVPMPDEIRKKLQEMFKMPI